MKLFITSNTQFGYKNISNNQFDYFNNILIPYLKNNSNENDLFIHGGNIFANKISNNIKILHEVMNIFEKISNFLKVYIIVNKSDNLPSLILNRIKNVNIINNFKQIDNISLISYKSNLLNISTPIVIYNGDYLLNPEITKKFKLFISTFYSDRKSLNNNIINIGSPYQLNKSHKEKKGIVELYKNNIKYIYNNYSPKFITKTINNIIELDNLKINNDFIKLNIKEDILKKKEDLNKLKIFINNNNIKNIEYIKDDKIQDEIKFNYNIFNIKNIINSYIKKNDLDIDEELKNIFTVYQKD
jgi:hypothetical protein